MIKNLTTQQVMSKKQEAWKQFNTNQIESANRIAEELYESGFASAELTYLMGCCQARLNSFSKAMGLFKESLTFQDSKANLPYIYSALGASANSLSQYDKAISYYTEALKVNPKLPEAYIGRGEAFILKGDFASAEKNYIKALSPMPGSGMPYYQLGHLEKKKDNGEKALEYFQQAVEREPTVAEYQIWLGDTLLKMDLIEDAKQASSKALALSPMNKIALGCLSAACARLGDYDEAFKNIDIALKENYLISDVAMAFLTVCKRLNRCDEAIAYAESCLATDKLSDGTARNLHAQLALTLDYCKRYDEAWHHIVECKKYKYALQDEYDSVTFKVAVENIISTYSPANLFGVPSSKIKHKYSPIFIVGMPRSGTSLVEQILAAHTDITACGELPIINDLIKEVPAILQSDKPWPYYISDMTQEHVNYLSEEYIRRLPKIMPQTVFVTDKMPHNFFVLGFIQLLFPDAKIIHCRRQPLDTCLSIYFANFHVGHEYSGSLFDIGTHYFQYLRLMEHWRGHLSLELLEMDYEALVNDPETHIRKLLDYCELSWDERCLHFNKLDREVKTASFDQVRQPIYTKSIDRWKNYEKYLGDLKSGLDRGY